INDEPTARAHAYADMHGLVLGKQLGFGVHGIVFVTEIRSDLGGADKQSAVKAHQREVDYCRERDVYLRLSAKKITKIKRFNVPLLLRYDNEYLILEMTVVKRPYILDFAGA